jgi:hypothetical protein
LNLNRLIAEKKEIPINSTLENLKPSLIKKRYGSPFFKVVNDFELFKVQIQFYRIKIGDHKVMLKTHLFEGKLWLYSYIFMNLKGEENMNIIDVIKKKYDVKSIDSERDILIDQNECQLFFSQKFDSLKLTYMGEKSSGFFSKIKDLSEEQKEMIRLKALRNDTEIYDHL